MALRRSALHPVAAATGAAFQERHGWDLATVYSTVEEEYLALTTAAGVHDASYTGRLRAIGADGLDLLNRLSTNKVLDLQPGQGAPTILTTARGRILDLIGVVNVDDYILLITIEQHGVKVMVDKKSYIYLVGTELEFSDGLNGKGFVFTNPNAKTSCGCGTSFSV